MGVNKVLFGGETVMDISDSTVTPGTLAKGATAYSANGEKITGTMEITKSSIVTALGYTPTKSVNGKTGETVTLSASDVGAVPTSKYLTGNKTYYVDANNGNDSNNGTSSSTAFATISKAINSIPSDLGGNTVTIILMSNVLLADGDLVKIHYKANGRIAFKTNSGVYTVEGKTSGFDNGIFSLKYSSCEVRWSNVSIKQKGEACGITVNEFTGSICYQGGTITGSKAEGVTATSGNFCNGIFLYAPILACIVNATITEWSNAAIKITGGLVNMQQNNVISNNSLGLAAEYGQIQGRWSVTDNSTNYQATNGGRILSGTQTSIPNY